MATALHGENITQVLDRVLDDHHGERVALGDIVQSLGERAYGPALLFIALVSMLPPISVTPGLPIFTGSVILLLSLQLLLMRRTPWLPAWLQRYSFSRHRLATAVAHARPWSERLGRLVMPRCATLVQPPFSNLIGFVCAVLAVLSLLLSPLPAGENIPAAGVLLFGLALTARDGLLALFGLLITGIAFGLLIYYWNAIVAAVDQAFETFIGSWSYSESAMNIVWVLAGLFALLTVGSFIRLLSLYIASRRTPPPVDAEAAGSAPRNASHGHLRSLLSWWVLAILLALAVLFGSAVAAVLFAIVSLLGLGEFRRLAHGRVATQFWWLAFLAVPIQYVVAYHGWLVPFWTFVPIGVFLILLVALVVSAETGKFIETAGVILVGLMLIVFLLSHAVLTFSFPGGAGLFLFLILVTEVNDIAQALWGRHLGRHKITPRVSPNKTWEGFLLGGATALVVAVGLAPVLTPLTEGTLNFGNMELVVPFGPAIAAGLLIVVSGFFGDLTVSAAKREVGVKDCGDVLPGQGGVLDRVDSLIFTAPVFFYFLMVFYR